MIRTVGTNGKSTDYRYDGLGNRVEQHGEREVEYILDITRDHNNLLQKIEDGQKQTFTWDHEILSMESKGCREYYIHDDLGSPIRAIGTNGTEEIYGYDEFGNDLYHNQTLFGYTGYEKDDTTGLLYAQARE